MMDKAIQALQALVRRHDLDAKSKDEDLLHQIYDALEMRLEIRVKKPLLDDLVKAAFKHLAHDIDPYGDKEGRYLAKVTREELKTVLENHVRKGK